MDSPSALLDLAPMWPTLALAVLVFSLAPHLVFQLVLLLYPRGNERRVQLLADLFDVPRWKKPFWVAEVGLMAVFEAVPLRLAARKQARLGPATPTTAAVSVGAPDYVRRTAVAAAAVVLLGSGLARAAWDAEPGGTLWPVTKVLYAERAQSIQADVDVKTGMQLARTALAEGRKADAAAAIASMVATLDWIAPEQGHDVLTQQIQELAIALGDPALLVQAAAATPGAPTGGPGPLKAGS